MALDRPLSQEETGRDTRVGQALGHRGEDLALAGREVVVPPLAQGNERRDDLGVEADPPRWTRSAASMNSATSSTRSFNG